ICDFLVFVIHQGGCAKTEEEEAASSEEDSSSVRGSGFCKWFNVRMGFGFLSMTHREGICLDSPVDVFVHQSKLHMEGFRSLKEGEAVAFTFKRCFNCGGPNHHAKECQLPPQPKKCHFCQSITHMVANCPIKAQQLSPGSQGKSTASTTGEEEDMSHTPFPPDSSD
uniref:Protein lin-28 homolog A n=1 Tax=Sinocyclocheilus anshuiensis TaxID=1608454 RepID=A0A671N9M5_9TELE